MQKTTTKPPKFEAPDLPAMKRADRRRADRELEYSRRDLRHMLLICGLFVALGYTSLWLIAKFYGA